MTPGRPSPRVLTVTAPPEHPDADLLAWEAELYHLVVEHARLEAAWPKGKTAVERARTGRPAFLPMQSKDYTMRLSKKEVSLV